MAAIAIITMSDCNLSKACIGHTSIVGAAASPSCHSRSCIGSTQSTNFRNDHPVMREVVHQLFTAHISDIAERITPSQLTQAEGSAKFVNEFICLTITEHGPYAVTGIRGRGSIFCRGIIGWGNRFLLWLGRLRLFRLQSLHFRYRRWFRSWAWCFCRL